MEKFTKNDMLGFIEYYDSKSEKDCFDTFEEELVEYLKVHKDMKLGRYKKIPKLTKEEINLNIDAIETKIAVLGWDNYNDKLYKNPKDQITDLYWLIEELKKL